MPPGTSVAELLFVPGDPPRTASFVVYEPRGPVPGDDAERVEVVVPAGGSVRKRLVASRRLSLADALSALLEAPADQPRSASWEAWRAVVLAGLGLIARGRLQPGVTDEGFDGWRVGPVGAAERALLAELAGALPPQAYAMALPGPGSPIRLPSPDRLVRAAWDALADTLVRTAAAPATSGSSAFALTAATPIGALRSWLEAAVPTEGGGASVSLRVELDETGGNETGGNETGGDETARWVGRAVVEVTSVDDPSLVVDAAEVLGGSPALLARFGAAAERDLLLTLRAGARAWPPLRELLAERVPATLRLDERRLDELLAEGGDALDAVGISLRWPAGLLASDVGLRAVVSEQPGVVVGAGLGLEGLVEFRWQATLDGAALSPEEVDVLAEAKRSVVRLRGRWVVVDPEVRRRLLGKVRIERRGVAEALGALLAGSVSLDGEQLPVVAEGPLGDVARRLRDLGKAGPAPLPPPQGLEATLRPYQARGVAWLRAMTELGIGACLADDMGLGKTLQVIALHLHRVAAGQGPTLVVCPTSLVANWEREVRRFAPGVVVRRYHGTDRGLDGLGGEELVITSYGVARRDVEVLGAAGFTLVVADEAQQAKNPVSATAKALRRLPARARVALTGTPMENRLSELWSVLDWTTPGLLGSLEGFTRSLAVPVERYQDPGATERLASMVRPFLLRRSKHDPEIAPELPERIVRDVPVALTAEQVTLYEAEVREAMAQIRSRKGIERQGLVLRLLTVLKQICNHPAQYLLQQAPLAGRSGKLAALEDLVQAVFDEGESVLVFSQFVEHLSLIGARLAELGVETATITGKVPAGRRTKVVDAFQGGEVPVLLLSLRAAGVGLNLTRATHVVHADRWWNPAVEDQATDRAYRIGQHRTVEVHRLVAEGTLEDRIASIIERKRRLAESIVGEGESWIAALDDDELAALVALEGAGA